MPTHRRHEVGIAAAMHVLGHSVVQQDAGRPVDQHDLLDPLPDGGPFHMILLRNNLLTYYQGPDLQAAFTRVVAILSPGGWLVTGAHERLPVSAFKLIMDKGCPWVFRLDTIDPRRINQAGT